MKIIINADDFGYSESVNQAIAEAFSRGWITNTTIMANMDGYLNAVALAKQEGFADRVGLHVNLFEGQPLSSQMRSELFVAEDGRMSPAKFHGFRTFHKFFLPYGARKAVEQECLSQMQRYADSGLTLKHLDSHFHAHTFLSVYRIIRRVNRKFGFKTIRLSLNMYVNRKAIIKIYKKLFNAMLRRRFKTSRYFTSAKEFVEVAKTMKQSDGTILWTSEYRNSVCEIMVHPDYDEAGRLINRRGTSFEELFRYVNADDQLISYGDV
ncbi:MAG: ChbG/HpnK family deacetylase [Clostridia bacterium]|nr:ChbG/HpnK family deacetylase [Clostridia bacterium]